MKFIDWVYTKENFTGFDSGFILFKFVWFYTYVISDVSHIDNFSTSEIFKLLFQRMPSLFKRLNVSGPKTFPIGHKYGNISSNVNVFLILKINHSQFWKRILFDAIKMIKRARSFNRERVYLKTKLIIETFGNRAFMPY